MPAPDTSANNEELQTITQDLYKQNLEIAERNKTLSLLGELYDISIQNLQPTELAEQLTKVIQEDLSVERVGISVYDEAKDEFDVLGFAESERFHAARVEADAYFDKAVYVKASAHPFFKSIFETRTMTHTEDLTNLWAADVPANVIQKIQEESHVKSLLAYPLVGGGRVIGMLSLTLNRTYDELVPFEQESIQSFISVIAIALDRAQVAEALQISNKKLEQANEQQVILIHFITHQLKGFVTKSRNVFSLLLEGDYGALPDTMKPLVEEGFRSDTKGAETIQEILNAANIKSGKVTYTMAPFDLKAMIEEITSELRSTAESKGLKFNVELGDALQFNGDRAQLVNAFKNLVDNSIKYTPSGEVDVTLHKENDKIHFEVKDTGVGITSEDMANLFTEGGHGKESQKINVESTGFGLYIVKNIIEGHGGKVWAESEGAGKGSRFIIELPAAS